MFNGLAILDWVAGFCICAGVLLRSPRDAGIVSIYNVTHSAAVRLQVPAGAMPGHVPVPPTTAGRRRAWLPSREGLETEAKPSSRPSSERSADATRSATRRSGRPAGDIAPPARTGSLTRAGLGGTALKHTQGTPVEKAARRWVISTPSVVDVGAESNVALLRSSDRLSLLDTWGGRPAR